MQEAKQHLQNGGDADDESDGLLDGEQGGDLGSEDDDVEDVTDDYLNRLTGQVPGHPALWGWVHLHQDLACTSHRPGGQEEQCL